MSKYKSIQHTIEPAMRPTEEEWLRLYNGDAKYKEEQARRQAQYMIQMTNPMELAIIKRHYL